VTDTTLDRRVWPRFPLILAAEVIEQSSGARLSGRTSDVSRTGCYVDTLNPIPAGSGVRILLMQGDESVELLGRVIYTSPGLGMGLCFDQPVPPPHLAILDRWLASAARVESS